MKTAKKRGVYDPRAKSKDATVTISEKKLNKLKSKNDGYLRGLRKAYEVVLLTYDNGEQAPLTRILMEIDKARKRAKK